jgi:hypothetical protein
VFRNLTSIQTYFLIAIALGAAGLYSLPLVQVVRSTDNSCSDAGGTVNENGTCVLSPPATEPKCQYEDWVYVPEMERCAPGPPLLDGGNPASGDNGGGGSGNATQGEEGS